MFTLQELHAELRKAMARAALAFERYKTASFMVRGQFYPFGGGVIAQTDMDDEGAALAEYLVAAADVEERLAQMPW